MDRMMDVHTATALLAWQIEMGADEPIGDLPVNRYAMPQAAPRPTMAAAAAFPPDVAPAAANPVTEARARADSAADLAALKAALATYDHCDLKKGARNLVFADGDPAARIMLIGEAPGRDEDIEGRPFVGRAGQLLDRMLAAIGMGRDGGRDGGRDHAIAPVYITNILPWRPPQNRDPSPDEIAMLLPFVERHIALVDPAVIVLLGNTPCAALLGRRGITGMRGKWETVLNRPAMPMFHPAYLLRTPHAKREAWADLLAVQARLREIG